MNGQPLRDRLGLAALVGALAASLSSAPLVRRDGGGQRAQTPSGLRLTYLGTAGWEIADDSTTILVDPYLTRAKYATPNDPVSADDPRPTVTTATVVASDTAVIDAHITRADLILVTHTHPDHTLDLPYIAKKTGATVVGTQSTANLARASGVASDQLRVVSGQIGRASCRERV